VVRANASDPTPGRQAHALLGLVQATLKRFGRDLACMIPSRVPQAAEKRAPFQDAAERDAEAGGASRCTYPRAG